ncbi:MAG: hypothetical protein JW969_20780 [Spirochaetales bacterium]|nr:hypothetical protein [Spirochaetales bacterium]
MGISELLKKLPKEGFIKVTRNEQNKVEKGQKAALIRKGNELYNKGQYEMAKKIFLTTNYTDGLIRLGEYYWKKKNPFEAFRMFWLAPFKKKQDAMVEKMAGIIRSWLQDKGEENE